MWHVSSRGGVATLRTAIHLLLTYLPIFPNIVLSEVIPKQTKVTFEVWSQVDSKNHVLRAQITQGRDNLGDIRWHVQACPQPHFLGDRNDTASGYQ